MARVTIQLPAMLRRFADGQRSVPVEAGSLRQALNSLIEAHPGLGVHLFDESGDLRQHVLCFHNRTNSRWMDSLDVALSDDDTISILQAVSGG